MQCAKCQRESEEGARICAYCGAPLEREVRKVSALRRAVYGILLLAIVGILAVGGWKIFKNVNTGEKIRHLEHQLEQTAEFAREIEDARVRAHALSKTAVALAEAGQREKALAVVEEALKSTNKVWKGEIHAMALGATAVVLVEAGRFERVLKIADEMKDDEYRNQVLGEIAVALVEAGQLERALEIASKIVDPIRINVLKEIATALVEAGRFEPALEIASKLKDEYRAYVLAEIAKSIAQEIKRLKGQT